MNSGIHIVNTYIYLGSRTYHDFTDATDVCHTSEIRARPARVTTGPVGEAHARVKGKNITSVVGIRFLYAICYS